MKATHDKTELRKQQAGQSHLKADLHQRQKDTKEVKDLTGYPEYPIIEDIYNQYKEENEINPEDISKIKESDFSNGKNEEQDLNDNLSGSDLDIPGAELDDDRKTSAVKMKRITITV